MTLRNTYRNIAKFFKKHDFAKNSNNLVNDFSSKMKSFDLRQII